jgi:hypothetical protein
MKVKNSVLHDVMHYWTTVLSSWIWIRRQSTSTMTIGALRSSEPLLTADHATWWRTPEAHHRNFIVLKTSDLIWDFARKVLREDVTSDNYTKMRK